MSKRFWTLATICLIGCTHSQKPASTVRPTRPDDPSEDAPPVSRVQPEEITPENYKSKIQQFEREMNRDGRKSFDGDEKK